MTKVVLVFVCAITSLAATAPYAPLPSPPAGFAIREVARFDENPVRIISNATGSALYVLAIEGNVYKIDLPDGKPRKIIEHASYTAHQGGVQTMGLCLDRDGRMYIVENGFDMDANPAMNHVTIFRSTSTKDGDPAEFKPWVKTDIPFAVDVFQHGVSYIAQGPDGMIYVSSGSRTDHGEAGTDPKRSREGETPLSACIWQLDPKSRSAIIRRYSGGIRNAFGFCWDEHQKLFATENGPNANPEEELNCIEEGKHYGFPFVFSEWTHKAYADQPDPPPHFSSEPPTAKFDPHSSPSGVIAYHGALLVARYGNLLPLAKDVGFDIVQVKLSADASGRLRGEMKPFLAPLARPTDLHLAPSGKIYICEHQRQLRLNGEDGPGRILELSPK
jgi:Glucose / Sorbosone dehydrogenase